METVPAAVFSGNALYSFGCLQAGYTRKDVMTLAWLILFVFLTFVALSPLRLRVDIEGDHGLKADAMLSIWGFRRQWLLVADWNGIRSEGRRGTTVLSPERMRQGMSSMPTGLWRDRDARRFLLRHLTLHQVDVMIRVHASDAAVTACATGLLRMVTPLLPSRIRETLWYRVTPDFAAIHSTLTARCIISCRLGILVGTAALLLGHRLAGKFAAMREATAWNTRSEN